MPEQIFSKSIDNCINYDLNRVYIWLSANKRTPKTEVLLIASRQKLSTFSETPSFSINDYTVKEMSSAKSLGVLIDQNFNRECHTQSICKKIASALGAIKRIRHLVPFSILMNVYNSVVQPHFDYCNAVWGNCGCHPPKGFFFLNFAKTNYHLHVPFSVACHVPSISTF